MALAHHDTAFDNQRGRCESVFFCAKQRGDDHVSAGLHLAICFNTDTPSQVVEHQCLVRLCQPKLPRDACVFNG